VSAAVTATRSERGAAYADAVVDVAAAAIVTSDADRRGTTF
jgi:hypothetical protein